MATRDIAAAMQRVEAVLKRRPEVGIHEDAPATAHWESGTRVVAKHANGTQIVTDMPAELGGSGDQVTPGWLFRAGLASCLATRIAMDAAAAGIELAALEVLVSSRSDLRGLFGIADATGEPVDAGPSEVQLRIRISRMACRRRDCGSWSKRAIVAHPCLRHCGVRCRQRCASKWI